MLQSKKKPLFFLCGGYCRPIFCICLCYFVYFKRGITISKLVKYALLVHTAENTVALCCLLSTSLMTTTEQSLATHY